jgi:hypothetical protein
VGLRLLIAWLLIAWLLIAWLLIAWPGLVHGGWAGGVASAVRPLPARRPGRCADQQLVC